jgi:hypothetical protein
LSTYRLLIWVSLVLTLSPAQAEFIWTQANVGESASLRSVTWTGDQFVVVGEGGKIYTSTNASDWNPQVSGVPNNLNAVTWTGTRLIAVGTADYVPFVDYVGKVAATAKTAATFGGILTSPDGIIWTSGFTGVEDGTSFTSVAGKQVAVGYFMAYRSSNDGASWLPKWLVGSSLTSMAWTGSQYVAVGYKSIGLKTVVYTSPDGSTWTLRTPTDSGSVLTSVSWVGGRLLATGYRFLVGSTRIGVIWTSSDGVSWTKRDLSGVDKIKSMAWTGSQIVAVGGGGLIWKSNDGGANWIQEESGTTRSLNSVVWTGEKLVATGDSGTVLIGGEGSGQITRIASPTLSMRQTSNHVFAALPHSISGVGLRAAVYSNAGEKMVDVRVDELADEVAIPLGGMARGVYLLELRGKGVRMTQAFSISR